MTETLIKTSVNKGWANLKPCKKGEVRNPNGRPKKTDCLIDCIKSELRSKSLNGLTKDQMIATILVAMAARGNLKAIELLMSYTTPKPTQALDVTTKGEAIGDGHKDIPPEVFRESLVILAKAGVSQN